MEDGSSPLYIACQNGHESTAQLLLSNGADIDLCIEDGTNPICVACFDGCRKDGASPLLVACENGNDRTVKFF